MDRVEELAEWMKQGCQRRAVAKVLRKPMISTEIWDAARTIAPRIQLRDVWFLLRQLEQKGLVICFNPEAVTGKLFCFSDLGKRTATLSCGIEFPALPPAVDWNLYSWVVRGSVRKRVLLELGKAQLYGQSGLTPSQIKRNFRGRFPIGKNPILRALQELERHHAIAASALSKDSRQKRHVPTEDGAKLIRWIQEREFQVGRILG